MENETCYAINGYTWVSHGHMMVIAKRHVESYFDLTYEEIEGMNQMVKNVKSYLDKQMYPDGYNIGSNIGPWAGQEISHACLHVIPRYAGDVPATELKGGILRFKHGKEAGRLD
jgi:diadenosine tetraphosphate (Ap4A) HIT family hydrolase